MDCSITFPSMSMFSNEVPAIILPSCRRSQSVTAVADLQRELHESVIENVGDKKETLGVNRGLLERCTSLPHLKLKGPVCPRNDGDNISIASATKSEDRVHELETDLIDARDTIQKLQETVVDLQANNSSLSSQLHDEREKNGDLQKELKISRKLCLELDAEHAEYYTRIHQTGKATGKEVGIQVDTNVDTEDEHNCNDSLPLFSVPRSPVACRSRAYGKENPGIPSQLNEPSEADITDLNLEEQVHELQQQCREKEFQIRKLTEKLSKYYHRNAELEAEQMSIQENLASAERKLSCRNQQVSHMQEVILHQQEDIALLEKIKDDLNSKCIDQVQREAELEELVESLNDDMNGLAKEKRKLKRHVKELNTSLENKQVEISEKLGQLEAKSNLLEVIKKIAYNSPSKDEKRTRTPRSTTSTPRNTPVAPRTREEHETSPSWKEHEQAEKQKTSTHEHDNQRKRFSSRNGDKVTKAEQNGKMAKVVDRRRRHASKSLNYNGCANPSGFHSDHHGNNGCHDNVDGYHGDTDAQPINGFYNDSYVSSSEDIKELDALGTTNPLEQNVYEKDRENADGVLDEQSFKINFHGIQSSPKTATDNGDQCVDDLIAEVLAEISGEDRCEADMQHASSEKSENKMEAEGLLLRKQELENYAMRARDRSWQYVYVVLRGSKLWFYESKEYRLQGQPLDGEEPIDLTDALVRVAVDYSKRKHVFRVMLLHSGKQILFQARDDRELLFWVCSMDSGTKSSKNIDGTDTFNGVTPGIGTVPPPTIGSPSKADRLRNIIRGSISALKK